MESPGTEKRARVYVPPLIAAVIGGIIALGISQGFWRLGDSLSWTLPAGVFSIILVVAIPCLIGGLVAGVFVQGKKIIIGLFAGLVVFAGTAIIDILDESIGISDPAEIIIALLVISVMMAVCGAVGGLLSIVLRR